LNLVHPAEDLELVAGLYERAAILSPHEFCTASMAQLASDLGATGAGWMVARVERGVFEPLESHGAEPLPELRPALERAVAEAGDAAVAWGDLAVRACAHPGSLFRSVLWLRRNGSPFTRSELKSLDLRAPHLVRAALMAYQVGLRLDPALQEIGRRSRGAACLCDASGAVFTVSPAFASAVRQLFPAWDGVRLPFPLPQDTAPAREVTVERLHLRRSQRGALTILHVRALHPFDELTRRERDVVNAMIGGRSFKALARRLGVSPSTVANHASNIYHKLGVYSRDDVVELARSNSEPPKQARG
jgi:DNA-binding CsgD family transcriptional regulator